MHKISEVFNPYPYPISTTLFFLLFLQVTILKGVSEPFLRSLSLTMKPCVFLPGDYIVHKGDIGYGMFFIHHGQVSGNKQHREEPN